mmetsp:Transcript_5638/g.16316  ORF Transcript_5638/g.16316 Transcript_5638/m.16316 type:complete len:233 (-) Transcript_5638:492-1190(-)
MRRRAASLESPLRPRLLRPPLRGLGLLRGRPLGASGARLEVPEGLDESLEGRAPLRPPRDATERQLREVLEQGPGPGSLQVLSGNDPFQRAWRRRLHNLDKRIDDVAIWSAKCGSFIHEQLQEDRAKRVHLGCFSHLPSLDVMRISIARSAADVAHREMSLSSLLHGAGQAKVRHLGGSVGVQEDVGRLDVAVEGLWRGVVHVRQARRRIQTDTQTLVPHEQLVSVSLPALV